MAKFEINSPNDLRNFIHNFPDDWKKVISILKPFAARMASYPDGMATPNKCYPKLLDATTTYVMNRNVESNCDMTLSAQELVSFIASGRKSLISTIGDDYSLINCKYSGGATLLMHASLEGREVLVYRLLIYGANPNIADKEGQTALMGAAYEGHEEIIKILLNYDADKSLEDKNGKTAYNYASDQGHLTAMSILEEHVSYENSRVRLFDNGDSYSGEYRDGKMDGKGVYKWADGGIYEGEFKAGLKHGKGSYLIHFLEISMKENGRMI
jgi:hypothetical protein